MRKTLTFVQKTAIYEKLKEVCHKTGDGLCRYSEGWDDEKVSILIGVTSLGVRSVRRDMFGNTKRNKPDGDGIKARITAIEEYLTSKNPNWKV